MPVFIIYPFCMKEKMQKIASLFADIAKAAKEGDTAALIAKLDEAAPVVEEATTEAGVADETATNQETEIQKVHAEIKKWADMYITAENLPKLLEDLIAGTSSFKAITKSVEELGGKIEAVAKTSQGSQQIEKDEKKDIEKSSSPLAWLAARL